MGVTRPLEPDTTIADRTRSAELLAAGEARVAALAEVFRRAPEVEAFVRACVGDADEGFVMSEVEAASWALARVCMGPPEEAREAWLDLLADFGM